MQTKLTREPTTQEGIIDGSLLKVYDTKKLGQGGFGVVYKGRYRGKEVAAKQILNDLTPETQKEFEAEARIMAQLHDPSVIHLYGVTQDVPRYMVLEYCTLGSLDKYLQNKEVAEVSWEVRFHLATGIASGLTYLHSYNPIIVHGDLKSLNVLLTGNPLRPDTKIADFGMAKLKTESQKKTLDAGGRGFSVQWTAPELFSRKNKKTTASDLYAFGMTMWEIASHQYPWAEQDPTGICTAVAIGEREDIPENTHPVFKKVMTDCWVQKPEERLSAKRALDALETYEPSDELGTIEKTMLDNVAMVSSGLVDSSSSPSGSSGSPMTSGVLKASNQGVVSQGAFSANISNNMASNTKTGLNSSPFNSGASRFASGNQVSTSSPVSSSGGSNSGKLKVNSSPYHSGASGVSSKGPVTSSPFSSTTSPVVSQGAFNSQGDSGTNVNSSPFHSAVTPANPVSTSNVSSGAKGVINSSPFNSGANRFSTTHPVTSSSSAKVPLGSSPATPVHSRTSSGNNVSASTEDKVKTGFFQAAKMGDQSKLSTYKELLDEGLFTRDSEGNTALHHAAANGHLEMVTWLVKEQEMNASERNQAEETPLLLAAQNGKQPVVEWLIQSGDVDEGERNSQGASALLLAGQQGHLGLVAWLLETGVSKLTEKDKQQNTVFSSPKEIVVLWAALYRNLLQSPDPANSPSFEKIQAYPGEKATFLHFTTLKTLCHFGAKHLLRSNEAKIKIWYAAFSEAEKLALSNLAATKHLDAFLPQDFALPPKKVLPTQPSRPPVRSADVSSSSTSSTETHFFTNPQDSTAYPPNRTKNTTAMVAKTPVQVSGTLPSVFQPEPKKIASYAEQVKAASKAVQGKIDQKELSALLKWVTKGHLVEVETLLKKAPILALGTGTVTDRSERTFKNVTVLQYAAWALDAEMAELIIGYLGAHNTSIQLKALANEPNVYSTHGASYDFSPLVTKTQTYVDNCGSWNYEKCCQYWQKEVGGEQRKCPAWLIYAWSEEGADVAWTKKDPNRPIKREYEKHRLDWWFTENYNSGRGVGPAWAAARGEGGVVGKNLILIWRRVANNMAHDLNFVSLVGKTRCETLQRLRATSDSQLTQSSIGLGKGQ